MFFQQGTLLYEFLYVYRNFVGNLKALISLLVSPPRLSPSMSLCRTREMEITVTHTTRRAECNIWKQLEYRRTMREWIRLRNMSPRSIIHLFHIQLLSDGIGDDNLRNQLRSIEFYLKFGIKVHKRVQKSVCLMLESLKIKISFCFSLLHIIALLEPLPTNK